MSGNKNPIYYLPIKDPNNILEGCEILINSLVTRIIEGQINSRTNYTDEKTVKRVHVTKVVIEYLN